MSLLLGISIALLLLLPPCFSIALILTDTAAKPQYRTTRAVGSGLILNAIIGIVFTLLGIVFGGSLANLIPLGIFALAVIAALRTLHLERVAGESDVLNDLKHLIIDI